MSSGNAGLKVFISYRRDDTASDARLVYDRLVSRFGSDNVFLDVVALEPGTQWLQTIRSRGESSGVVLVLIGPRWLSILTDRAQARFDDPSEDVVKLELELALRRGSGVEVIPVLVGGAVMPAGDALPKSLRRLSATHAIELRHLHFDQDAEALITLLARIAARGVGAETSESGESSEISGEAEATVAQPPELSEAQPPPAPPPPPSPAASHGMSPDERHYEAVMRFLVDQGTVVPLLGSGVCGTLPDAEKIAADLARRFGLEAEPLALPRVAQQVFVSSGRPDLIRTLRQILATDAEPSPVHRFLARFPGELERLGLPPRYQMIVTTNYDTTLERAFDEENEPYDVAVYVASGAHQAQFVHFPFGREPEPISVPNRYGKFPIDDYGELERTVIVKVHGTVGGDASSYGTKDNFVITEDHYIDYLSTGPVESLVPVQILGKLTESHCLFLGYATRDWHLRVFLKRIWRGEPLGSRSWAIEREPDVLEKEFWGQFGVEYFAAKLEEYVAELQREMLARSVRA